MNRKHLYRLTFVLILTVVLSICLIAIKSQPVSKSDDHARQDAHKRSQINQGASRTTQISEKERKVAKMAIRATEEMREAGFLASKPGVYYSLTNDEGKVTNDSLERAGIDLARKPEVKAIVDRLWEDMSVEMAKRLVFDEKSSKPEQGLRIYKIPADRAFADNRLNSFKEELRTHFGGTESEILSEGLKSTNHFGWFGKFDLDIRFIDANPSDPGFIKQVEFSGRDPKSGRVVSGGKFAQEGNGLRSHFGSIFDHINQ